MLPHCPAGCQRQTQVLEVDKSWRHASNGQCTHNFLCCYCYRSRGCDKKLWKPRGRDDPALHLTLLSHAVSVTICSTPALPVLNTLLASAVYLCATTQRWNHGQLQPLDCEQYDERGGEQHQEVARASNIILNVIEFKVRINVNIMVLGQSPSCWCIKSMADIMLKAQMSNIKVAQHGDTYLNKVVLSAHGKQPWPLACRH